MIRSDCSYRWHNNWFLVIVINPPSFARSSCSSVSLMIFTRCTEAANLLNSPVNEVLLVHCISTLAVLPATRPPSSGSLINKLLAYCTLSIQEGHILSVPILWGVLISFSLNEWNLCCIDPDLARTIHGGIQRPVPRPEDQIGFVGQPPSPIVSDYLHVTSWSLARTQQLVTAVSSPATTFIHLIYLYQHIHTCKSHDYDHQWA